jgi:hypothetical protein
MMILIPDATAMTISSGQILINTGEQLMLLLGDSFVVCLRVCQS